MSDFLSLFFPLKKNKKRLFFSSAFGAKGKEKEHDDSYNGEEATLGSAEEDEEKGERRARFGNGAVEAWSDEVVDRVGGASEGCVCLACDFEIEWDGSIFLFRGEWRESRCA